MTKFTHPKDAPEGHKWQTRDGDPVRILCYDEQSAYPIVALVGLEEYTQTYDERGLFYPEDGEGDSDLIDVPAPEQWVNVYMHSSREFYKGAVTHETLKDAQAHIDPDTVYVGTMLLK